MEIFQDLSPKEMEELDRLITLSAVKKGKVFYRPEETGEVLFIVKEGRVQLYRISPEGKKLVIATLGAGTLFGEMPLLGQQLHNTFAEASEESVICIMSRKDLERLFLSKPMVAFRVLDITGHRLRDVEERLKTMAFKGIPARLASLLLLLAEENETWKWWSHPSGPGRDRGHLPRDRHPSAERSQVTRPDRDWPQADSHSRRGGAVGGSGELRAPGIGNPLAETEKCPQALGSGSVSKGLRCTHSPVPEGTSLFQPVNSIHRAVLRMRCHLFVDHLCLVPRATRF